MDHSFSLLLRCEGTFAPEDIRVSRYSRVENYTEGNIDLRTSR